MNAQDLKEFGSISWDFSLMLAGVALGYGLAVQYDIRKTRVEFERARNLAMHALVASLKENSRGIEQMLTVEIPNGSYPSYPLDTAALALINFGARPILPRNTDWPERLNRLRFELDHINRRILMVFVLRIPIDTNYVRGAWAAYSTTQEIPQLSANPWSGVLALMLRCKTAIDEQVVDFERLGYTGEVVSPYD